MSTALENTVRQLAYTFPSVPDVSTFPQVNSNLVSNYTIAVDASLIVVRKLTLGANVTFLMNDGSWLKVI